MRKYYLINNKDKLNEMGQKARILAEKRADWDENSKKLLIAYQQAIQTTTAKRKEIL